MGLCTADGVDESKVVIRCESECLQRVDRNVTRSEETSMHDACEATAVARYKVRAQTATAQLRKHVQDV